MKITIYLAVLLFVLSFNISAQEDPGKHEGYKVEPKELSDGTLYGSEIDPSQPVIKLSDIFASLESYQNKNVVIEGTMTELCKEMGCWLMVTDGTNEVRAQTLHKYFLPKDLPAGSKVVMAGEFEVKEITEEQAKHFAEESKDPKVKAEDIKGPQKMYRIKATGVKVLK